jgi:hypothetical protein
MRKLAAKLPFVMPADVLRLYQWKNGCSSSITLIPEFQFMPFQEVVQWVEGSARLFPRRWLPLFTNGGGDFLYVDADPSTRSPILIWRTSLQQKGILAFDSLLAMFQTIAEAHRRKLFRIHEMTTPVLTGADYETLTRPVTVAKHAASWLALRERLNPIASAGKGDERSGLQPRRVTGPETIPLHIKELHSYGEIKTCLPAAELKKELDEIEYLLSTMAEQLGQMKELAPRSDFERARQALQDLRKLQRALATPGRMNSRNTNHSTGGADEI